MMPERTERLTLSGTADLLYTVSNLLAPCWTVPIRSRFGREYPGWGGLVCFLAMPTFSAFVESQAVLFWWQGWLVILGLRRAGMFIREWRGDWEVSAYPGWKWLGAMLPWPTKNERTAERREPFLYLLAGYIAAPYDWGLSMFFYTGFGCLSILSAVHGQLLYKEKLAIRD